MTVEEICEVADKVVGVTVGGMGAEDMFALADMMQTVKDRVPMVLLVPTDVYRVLLDDGRFERNAAKFTEIYNRHLREALTEYSAYKTLEERASKVKG